MSWIMPVMVAASIFGGLSVHIMTSSRMCFVGARYGHFPAMLSHISIEKFTPTPSLVFLNILSLVMLSTSDIYLLITYSSIVESVFIMLSVTGILWLRWKRPNMVRPIKVSLWVPAVFLIVCLFLVIVLCYARPFEVIMGAVITLTGLPAFWVGVMWQNKPLWFRNMFCTVTCSVQKLFLSAKEE
ncbi:Cystine/glutamate transporter [Zootermopsis nevadensis]|uniref:Cystine/glutamate transporter n=2 Tax=Zootermopsis nevadensis TaxID=136037 RepID=A0A067QRZ1_ZOONE|nr:Cystine/glutamate transporter [Zootermopsis nevadensis]